MCYGNALLKTIVLSILLQEKKMPNFNPLFGITFIFMMLAGSIICSSVLFCYYANARWSFKEKLLVSLRYGCEMGCFAFGVGALALGMNAHTLPRTWVEDQSMQLVSFQDKSCVDDVQQFISNKPAKDIYDVCYRQQDGSVHKTRIVSNNVLILEENRTDAELKVLRGIYGGSWVYNFASLALIPDRIKYEFHVPRKAHGETFVLR